MKNKKQASIIFMLLTSVMLVLGSCRKEKITPEQANSFIKYYGKGGTQKAGNVALTPDGGYILVGTTDSYGDGKQILVIKTDKFGNEQWNKVLGGAGDDEGNWIEVTTDGGYIIAGSKAESTGMNTNVWIIKLGSNGTQIWSKEFGVNGTNESAARVINTLDGGYISVGTYGNYALAKSAVYLLKMISTGDTTWSAKYANGTSNDLFNYGTAIQQIDNLNYLTSGYTIDEAGTASSLDMLVTKGRLQSTGYGLTSNIGKSTYQSDNVDILNIKDAQDIILANGGDKYILGTTTAGDIYILHTAADEAYIGYKSFSSPDIDVVSGFYRTSDGGFVIAGTTTQNGTKDILIIRIDSNLSLIWMKTFGGTGNDIGSSVIQLADGSFVVSGTISLGGNGAGANDVMALIHINSNGELK